MHVTDMSTDFDKSYPNSSIALSQTLTKLEQKCFAHLFFFLTDLDLKYARTGRTPLKSLEEAKTRKTVYFHK